MSDTSLPKGSQTKDLSGSQSKLVLSTIVDGVARVTLNRPENMNTVDVHMAHALMDVFHDLERNGRVRAVLLNGSGRSFCAGGDLAAFSGAGDDAPVYVKNVVVYLHEAISTIARMNAPVVAAVRGSAAGAGMALACACDLVIAAETARFVMAYTKIGVTPDGSSTWFLPRLIGLHRSLELALLNRELSAPTAQNWGIVTDVVPEEDLDMHAFDMATKLAHGSFSAMGVAKKLLRESVDRSLESQMMKEAVAISEAMSGNDAHEGMDAFFAKRAPKFER